MFFVQWRALRGCFEGIQASRPYAKARAWGRAFKSLVGRIRGCAWKEGPLPGHATPACRPTHPVHKANPFHPRTDCKNLLLFHLYWSILLKNMFVKRARGNWPDDRSPTCSERWQIQPCIRGTRGREWQTDTPSDLPIAGGFLVSGVETRLGAYLHDLHHNQKLDVGRFVAACTP